MLEIIIASIVIKQSTPRTTKNKKLINFLIQTCDFLFLLFFLVISHAVDLLNETRGLINSRLKRFIITVGEAQSLKG